MDESDNLPVSVRNKYVDLLRAHTDQATRIAHLEEALRKIAGMTKENEHDLFSATRVAEVALSDNVVNLR